MKVLLAVFVLAITNPVAAAVTEGKIAGTYFFAEESCGADGKDANCVMSFNLTGKAARTLYDRMKVKAVKDECSGGSSKSDKNGLTCYTADGEYNCHFGYSFAKQKMGNSDVTC